jgi:hypothetical protein
MCWSWAFLNEERRLRRDGDRDIAGDLDAPMTTPRSP